MITLLRYQLFLHLRMVSTFVMIGFIGVSAWLLGRVPDPALAGPMLIPITSSLSIWITLTFFVQLSALHHVFFHPEAVQYRLARIRNRSVVIGVAFVHTSILAMFATLPYAVLYLGAIDEMRIAWLSLANVLVFHLFLGMAAALILRFIGASATAILVLLLVLFLLPLGYSGLLSLSPGWAANPVAEVAGDWLRSHLDVFSNPDMLLLRGIQDVGALLRTLILTPILILLTYVHFIRGDHH